jgi:hypothetical protein
VGQNILTFRRISSFKPPMKQLIKNGSLKPNTCVASLSNSVWYSRILPVCCNFTRAFAESSYSVGLKQVKRALENSCMLPWGWQPSLIDTTVETLLPDERKQCESAVLAGSDGIRRIAPLGIAIPKDRHHRNSGSQGLMPKCGWSCNVARLEVGSCTGVGVRFMGQWRGCWSTTISTATAGIRFQPLNAGGQPIALQMEG